MEGDLLTSAPEAEDRALRAELIGQIDVMPHQGLSAHESVLAIEGTSI